MSTGSTIGEKLTMQPDPDGLKFGDTQRRGHERRDDCRRSSKRHLLFFIVHGGTIKCKVSGKKKNIQKMLRGGLEVPEFDIKGETVLQPLYGASKTN